MRDSLSDWVESRTGLRSIRESIVREPMRGGPRWRHIFGSVLAGTFLIQALTGWLLMTTYVPSANQAWGSVWYIQNGMTLGWFIRGLHHFGSSAMMILMALHLIQVVLTAAYRAPREVNWWLGLGLMSLVLAFSLTGYLLPWDQKGYWATRVATNIAGSTPVIGPALLTLLIGGSDYGSLTLTRLFSLHVGLLPLAMLSLLLVHVLLYYRHGNTAPAKSERVAPSWPGQSFRNLAGLAVVVAVLAGLAIWNHGANLEAPADPTRSDYPARPEWYFLPLFQLLNHLVSPFEVLGTHVLPGLLVGFLAALPLLDKVLPRRLVYWAGCLVLGGVLGGAGFLMAEAIQADRANASYHRARLKADQMRERALLLASAEGVPPDGAINLLRRDPMTQGAEVLERSCLSCHVHGGRGQSTVLDFAATADERAEVSKPAAIAGLPEEAARMVALRLPDFQADEGPSSTQADGDFAFSGTNGKGEQLDVLVAADGSSLQAVQWSAQSASDLKGFGSEAWIRGLLEDPSSDTYFGTTPQLKGMRTWKKSSKLDSAQLDEVARFVAALGDIEKGETGVYWYSEKYLGKLEEHPGHADFVEECGKCHVIVEPGLITEGGLLEAPDLFGYGSKAWTEQMILDPESDSHYGYLDDEDRMPGFEGQLSDNDLVTLVRYLKGDYLGGPAQAKGASAASEAAVGVDLPRLKGAAP